MELMRATWTDSRLDDLNRRVDEIRDDKRDVRGELREMRGEIGALKRTIIQVGGGFSGTLLIGILTLIGTHL
jgi:predicted  nucleic acid-binding Zn-ribbon protein